MVFNDLVEKTQKLECRYVITKEVFFHFQKMCNDLNPLHTDSHFAQQKGFPECVMYGNILNGFVSHFVGMALPSPNVMIQTQDIQYRKPLFLGDQILLTSEIQEWSEAVEIINYKLKFYRCQKDKRQLVATGHVQIGVLHDIN